MSNRPLAYMLSERKANLGKMAGKIVIQARPTGRKRVDHRSFCDEVAHATTFTGAEVEAVLRLAAEIAKRHVENGDIVDFGDIGTLSPSSKKYFTLTGVSYERVTVTDKASKKPAKKHSQSEPEIAIEP